MEELPQPQGSGFPPCSADEDRTFCEREDGQNALLKCTATSRKSRERILTKDGSHRQDREELRTVMSERITTSQRNISTISDSVLESRAES